MSIAALGIAVALVALFLVIGFGPGWFVVRRFHWGPLEALTTAIGFSWILVFLAAFGAHWLEVHQGGRVGISLVAAVLTAVAWKDARALWRHRIVRRSVVAFAGLAAWTLLLLTLLHQYGGAGWCCDWLEHYQRTRNFITRYPFGFRYINIYLLPTRPPLMNAVAAIILGQIGFTFWTFQILFTFLNLLVFFPCVLVSRLFTRNGRPADPRLVAVLLGANPMFFMNTTYTWTKAFTAFFVLLGVALYLTAWRRRDRLRLRGAFFALGAAAITHYSAGLCAIFVGLHYLAVGRRRFGLRRAAILAPVVPGLLLVALWLGYVGVTYGAKGLLDNPSLRGSVPASAEQQVETRWLYLWYTFAPYRYHGYRGYPTDAGPLRQLADNAFAAYQSNAIFAIGSVSGLLVIILAAGALRREPARERNFWLWFIVALCLVGPAIQGPQGPGPPTTAGSAQLTLQPLIYVALAFLATRLRGLGAWVKWLWGAGALLDVALGIGLEVWFESGPAWARTPNWDMKARAGVHFIADYWFLPVVSLILLGVLAVLAARYAVRHVLAPG